jgi:hypothetical protein
MKKPTRPPTRTLDKRAFLAMTISELESAGFVFPKILRRPLTTTQRLVLQSLRRATDKETL